MNRPVTRVVAYLWHPLPLWEIANSGHVDALMVALMLLGLWIALAGHALRGAVLIAFSALVKPYVAPVLAGIWRPWDLKMPLVVIAAAALCYLPYLSVGWGVLGFLTKGYLTEEGISAGNDLWLLSLWRLAFGEHQGDVVAYVVLAALVLLFKGLSVARNYRSHRRVPSCRHQHAVTPGPVVVVAQLSLVLSRRHAVCRSVWLCANMGRFDRSAVVVRTTRLGFLHSKNGDKIRFVRRSFAGVGLCCLEDPHAAHRRRRGIAMSLSGEAPGTRAPFDPRRYHESGHGRAHRGRPASAGLPLSGSDQPLQSACAPPVLAPTRSSSRRRT